jgi:hypothetical protein
VFVKDIREVLHSGNEQNRQWETIIENIGFPQGKDKTIITDLSGKFLSGNHQVLIVTNMETYWDQAFFSSTRDDIPQRLVRLHHSMYRAEMALSTRDVGNNNILVDQPTLI